MPYIKYAQREHLDASPLPEPRDAGELNYVISQLVRSAIHRWGGNYQAMNDVLGALEGAKLELYRRVIGPYEQQKIAQNGDL